MDVDYYEITAELDAREILRYLNDLGFHNISGEVLKYFITDLKKLIKFDLQQRKQISSSEDKFDQEGPERLHSATTFSSRMRSRCSSDAPITCTREYRPRKGFSGINTHSAPTLRLHNINDKPVRRACSCVRLEKENKPDTLTKEKVVHGSNNIIKVSKPPTVKKCDPVSLYHHYTSLWAKYKPNVPGENNWSELRWQVRQKMAGNVIKQISNKVPEYDGGEGELQSKKGI